MRQEYIDFFLKDKTEKIQAPKCCMTPKVLYPEPQDKTGMRPRLLSSNCWNFLQKTKFCLLLRHLYVEKQLNQKKSSGHQHNSNNGRIQAIIGYFNHANVLAPRHQCGALHIFHFVHINPFECSKIGALYHLNICNFSYISIKQILSKNILKLFFKEVPQFLLSKGSVSIH